MVSSSVVKESYSRSCWEITGVNSENGVSSERDSERNSSFSDSRRLKNQKTKNLDFGGDKTDTPTDMLHKEAQVAFKILMTH